MSAILSADDLNDFITPGVACIKPVETLPNQRPDDSANPYEVTTEDKVDASKAAPAQITLTDCLACSGCVTSAEAVLVSLQSQTEVLTTLDTYPPLSLENQFGNGGSSKVNSNNGATERKLFIASVSPQVRASVAATYGVSERQAGNMIDRLLSGSEGLKSGGTYGSGFQWVFDTNTTREATLVLAAEEVNVATSESETPASNGHTIAESSLSPKKPILTSACPGWICYAEKTHPHILPHLSRLKSPQALIGSLLKSVLSQQYGIPPDRIWHLAVMPCFDKKLEASRAELTDTSWQPSLSDTEARSPVRDVDCVITARELLMLADDRGISFLTLSKSPLRPRDRPSFPDPTLNDFLFPRRPCNPTNGAVAEAGSSGGYLWHILHTQRALHHPSSRIQIQRGRNADVVEYMLVDDAVDEGKEKVVFKAARYYGFRNIQNLVRRLRPPRPSRMPGARPVGMARRPVGKAGEGAKEDYAYVEVMACPGGCTNGGGQIKVSDVVGLRKGVEGVENGGEQVVSADQKAWLARVDEAYFSGASGSEDEQGEENEDVTTNGLGDGVMDVDDDPMDVVNGISRRYIMSVLRHWEHLTGVGLDRLAFTSYREVESDVGKDKMSETERVAGLASAVGGGW
ncbi:cytosolic Fe-S cluster assembly factor NAR1 [Viridothelium virens]|uniref:Nuclear architecture-related protein 1 n=1 Tax=Viridothelium virens TaxID=1048519 RepID=A0A6A6H7R2_VIRVR|nr:cytosolic Fe-S cluster assembly factor NAR1 [Viridothelium virens]